MSFPDPLVTDPLVTDPLVTGEVDTRSNVVFIAADDMRKDDLKYLPKSRALLGEQGTTFSRCYASSPTCAPSRATILTGQYAHNHKVLSNIQPYGGFEEFRRLGRESQTIATALKGAGYTTALVGKYMNGYAQTDPPAQGWDHWRAIGEVSEDTVPADNQAPALAADAAAFIQEAAAGEVPFFLYFTPPPPHNGSVPSEAHASDYPNARAPRGPAFDEADVSDKPLLVSSKPRLTDADEKAIDENFRTRIRTLGDLDDAVETVVASLEQAGVLENTYIFFTSDNGFHFGEHRLILGKSTAYEEDISVPLMVRGPGVSVATLEHLALNTDYAPTFCEIAGTVKSNVDGRSLLALLSGERPPWRNTILIEQFLSGVNEARWRGVRTRNYVFVRYPRTGERELYNTLEDPYELANSYEGGSLANNLAGRLDALKSCSGDACRTAEGP